ncbi:hypothetical protein C7H83_00365 [Tetragenococcus halophilus]|uniref:Nucleotidyl transferase AbiEii/AbiGii toxin family protein n=2 Tax=Tetragenococcus halophilus TaxID=51669 RepID=A0A3G5FG35_TETHA|nr:hypothetical protein C7H83_00365 [Tetragenococcus halophilus]GBD64107.1 putative uncharacterized protein [Tetragenococcus halophilus subsp. flandriensis]MDN6140790.1 nucleotidyl transferase AbiEii/AbiGii toxin family protein [Tetragenococcus halophilus]GEQ37465.1 abortive infection protein [Tetragenococcus halophilus]GEQ39713.1 abortive infection protein [Tetragenococcus halophilus]
MLSKQKMKNLIRQKAKETGLPSQQLYGLYAMDQFVAQLSETEYSKHLTVKGGFLLTTSYGLENRATGDLDFTVKGLDLNEENIKEMVNSLQTPDGEYIFDFKGLRETREAFDYNGYELKLMFNNGNVKIPLNVDLTTGEDLIEMDTGEKVRSVFTDEEYSITGYPVEQILTDKFYTLMAYGEIDDSNSRMKDYYDLYLLTKAKLDIDLDKVNVGLDKTMNQRDNAIEAEDYDRILEYLKQSNKQKEMWSNFEVSKPYAEGISFDEVMDQIQEFLDDLVEVRKQNYIDIDFEIDEI